MTKKKIIIIILCIIGLVYLSGVLIFSKVTYYNTLIDNEHVNFDSKSQIEKTQNDKFNSETITIKDDVVEDYEISKTKLGVTFDASKLTNDIFEKQKPFFWPIQIFQKKDYDSRKYLNIDEDIMKKQIEKDLIDDVKRKKSVDAQIKYDTKQEKFIIVDDKRGTIISDEVYTNLKKSLLSWDTEFDVSKHYKPANVKSDDLAKTLEQINKKVNREIKIDFSGKEITIPKQEVAGFLLVDKENNVGVNNTNINNYLLTLASENSYAKSSGNKRIVTSFDIKSPYYQIENALLTDDEGEIKVSAKPQTFHQQASQRSLPTSGTYIEVSISQQYMWLYNNDKLVLKTAVVTGNHSLGRDTPQGTYKIWNKERNKVLDGATVGYDYKVPVDYWMAVDYTGVGIHDIGWLNSKNAEQSREVYKTNGSHGCINTPDDLMHIMYENTPIGTPVYIVA